LDRRRRRPQHPRVPRGLDPRPPAPEAGQQDARDRPQRAAAAGPARLPEDAAMTVVDAPRLRRSWAEPAGIVAWFATVDHKRIGTRYMATALLFFFLGGARGGPPRASSAQRP